MDKEENTKSRITLWKHTLTLSLIISILVFLGFRPLFELTPSGISKEILVAGIGALFVTLITLILLERQAETQKDLLRQQQEAQEKQRQSEHLYIRKIDQYTASIEQLREILGNGQVSIEDLDRGRFALVNLQLFGHIEACEHYQEILEKMLEFHSSDRDGDYESRELSDDEKSTLFELLCDFSNACRKDLHLDLIPRKQTEALISIEEEIEEKRSLGRRQALSGGLSEFTETHELSDQVKEDLAKLLEVLRVRLEITLKYTRSEISIGISNSASRRKNLAYLRPNKFQLVIISGFLDFKDEAHTSELLEELVRDQIEAKLYTKKSRNKPQLQMKLDWHDIANDEVHEKVFKFLQLSKHYAHGL